MADSEVVRFDPFAGRRRSMQQAASDLFDDESGVVIGDDGSLTFGAITLLPTALQINGHIAEAEWLKVGGVIHKLESSLQFLKGDLVLYGEREYGKTYEWVAALYGYEIDTLRNIVSVCNRVKTSLRSDKLSFEHHKLVAPFAEEPSTQRYWLHEAALNGWTVAEMRKAMKPAGKPRTPSAKQLYARFQSKTLPALEAALDDLSAEQLQDAFKLVQAKFNEAWDKKQPKLTEGGDHVED